jgi:hypothetical protein
LYELGLFSLAVWVAYPMAKAFRSANDDIDRLLDDFNRAQSDHPVTEDGIYDGVW